MSKRKLRESIAVEAARLVVRGKESDYTAARKRAARYLSRRKVDSQTMPTNSEIHTQVYALVRLFNAEQQQTSLFEIRSSALAIMECLRPFDPRVSGPAVEGPVLEGCEISIAVTADSLEEVVAALKASGFPAQTASLPETGAVLETFIEVPGAGTSLNRRFPCRITVSGLETPAEAGTTRAELEHLHQASPGRATNDAQDDRSATNGEQDYHPDAFSLFHMLLARLANVSLDPELHPEGDALYHSLQVFELGKVDRAYDEEFLLACLLHDVGLGIDPRRSTEAALEALGGLLTERTGFLIEHRVDALEYLKTARVARSLRRSEHFEDLLLLARCDLDGRVPGADVPELDEALDYIAGLKTAWDDV